MAACWEANLQRPLLPHSGRALGCRVSVERAVMRHTLRRHGGNAGRGSRREGDQDRQAVPSGSGGIRNDLAYPAAQTCYTVADRGTITRTASGTVFAADGAVLVHRLCRSARPGGLRRWPFGPKH